MSGLVAVGAWGLLGGGVLAAGVGIGGATAAGAVWRRIVRGPDALLEPGLALVGLIGTASVLTVVLLLLWGADGAVGTGDTLEDPLFAASLLATMAGHLSVIAWARALRAPLALVWVRAKWLVAGLGTGVAALGVSAMWLELSRLLGISVPDQGIVTSLSDAPAGPGRVAALVFVVAVAPVLEELVFRGYLQTALRPRVGAVGAGVASAFLFGLFHLADPAVVPALAVIGGLFAWVRQRSGSVLPAVLGHVLNNSVAIALALAGG